MLTIYDDVTAACSAAAAKAVLGYTDHLKTLQFLENITDSNCTSGKYNIMAANCNYNSTDLIVKIISHFASNFVDVYIAIVIVSMLVFR